MLPNVCYNTSNGTLAPGVFFYRAELAAPSGSFSVVVAQTKAGSCSGYFEMGSGNQVNLLSAKGTSCATNLPGVAFTQNSTTGAVTASISDATAGATYILSVKYSAKSSVTPICTYNFAASIGGTTASGSQ